MSSGHNTNWSWVPATRGTSFLNGHQERLARGHQGPKAKRPRVERKAEAKPAKPMDLMSLFK